MSAQGNVTALVTQERPGTQAQPALVPATMGEAMKLAEMMASSTLVPAHLQGKPADCFLVVEQSIRWRLSPFAVAQCTSVIQGKLMYEGKLVSAVVNALGDLAERLSYVYTGVGKERAVRVRGRLAGEKESRDVDVILRDAATNNRMWQSQPDQQLAYHGARVWARRHMPELMLGVYSPEEMDPGPPAYQPPATATAADAFEEVMGGPGGRAEADAAVSLMARAVDVERFYRATSNALGWDKDDTDAYVRRECGADKPIDLPRPDLERMTREVNDGLWNSAGPNHEEAAKYADYQGGNTKMTEKTRKGLFAAIRELGNAIPEMKLNEREACLSWINSHLTRKVESRADLTEAEGKLLRDQAAEALKQHHANDQVTF